jgi:hypothetical protein
VISALLASARAGDAPIEAAETERPIGANPLTSNQRGSVDNLESQLRIMANLPAVSGDTPRLSSYHKKKGIA